MAWEKKLTQLNDVLGDLIPIKDSIPKYVQSAGLRMQDINTNGNASDIWNSVINEADKHEKVNDLVGSILKSYPDNPFLISAISDDNINYSLSPDIDEVSDWKKVDDDTLEVLTTNISTLLPISFLELGIQKSKAVAKIEIKAGNTIDVGTGFLFQIDDINEIFFMTNFHVINNKEKIERTRIIFNFELDINGDSKASKSFTIDENGPWYLSPVHELDVNIFKLNASIEDLLPYKPILLREAIANKNEFVNVIQHPGGQMKQISLYHNVVTNSDERAIQYLTDTLKGSSGSPVFNSSWEVVALHHSGGPKKDNEPDLPLGFKSRNEGIHVNKIIQFLINQHKN